MSDHYARPDRTAPADGSRALDRTRRVAVDVPMRGLQALIGQRNMPYMFLLPNLAFFGLFVFLPIWRSTSGFR